MKKLTLDVVAGFCGARVKSSYKDIEVSGISRDNRTVEPGDLFVAIQGEKFDGHDFVESAAKAGACAALVSRPMADTAVPTLLVEDTVSALQAIAREYRKSFEDITVVGITGSVGKTTTKEMCASVLAKRMPTHKTQGNLNNDIGMPFTVMALEESHRAAVFEMGANHFGEISRLTHIARPDIAVITAIGESHMEFFKSKEGVRRAKLEILEGLKSGGTLVLNGDDPMLWELRDKLSVKCVYCGIHNDKCDLFGEILGQDSENIRFAIRGIDGVSFHIRCGGVHNMQNALLAAAVGKLCGCTAEDIRQGLESFVNTGARQKVLTVGGATVISDCYNASPDSMRAALNVLGDAKCYGRKIAALGDMLELGSHSAGAHFDVGKFAAQKANMIFAAGKWAKNLTDGAREAGFDEQNIVCRETVPELARELAAQLRDGDVLLVKGSRGMRMEQVIEALNEK